jgi:hypothetical protein
MITNIEVIKYESEEKQIRIQIEGIRCQARMYVGKNVILPLSLFFAGYLQRKFPRLFGPPACNGKNV